MSKDESTPVGAKRAVASGAATGKRGRFSIPRKAEAVLRLLRGEDLELLSRELGVIASTLSLWREQFLAAGQSSLKGKTGKTDERDKNLHLLSYAPLLSCLSIDNLRSDVQFFAVYSTTSGRLPNG